MRQLARLFFGICGAIFFVLIIHRSSTALTLTPNLSLGKPAIGESSWGTTLNNNADTIDNLFNTIKIDAVNNRVGIGTTVPDDKLHVSSDSVQGQLKLHLASTSNIRAIQTFQRARGTTAAPTAVASGDVLGSIIWDAYDGNSYNLTAEIRAFADATIGDEDTPSRLEFQVTPDGSATRSTVMTIKNDGNVGIGTSTLASDSRVEVAGHLNFEGTAPTVSACGASPSIVGTDNAGKVTTGSGIVSCTLTFATAWANAPACVMNDETVANLLTGASTTTTLVISSGSDIGSDVISYICIGRG